MLSQVACFQEPIKYIGLNIEGEPDLVMSYMSAEQMMQLLNIFYNHTGRNFNTSLSSMMSICGGVAARTYWSEKYVFLLAVKTRGNMQTEEGEI